MSEFEKREKEKEIIQFANNLKTDFPQFIEDQQIKINICAYQINTLGKYPFLQYFLLKNLPEHEMIFPTFNYIYTESEPITEVVEVILNKIFNSYEKPNSLFQYKGFICTKNNELDEYYVFYDCSVYKIDCQLLYKRNDIWLVLSTLCTGVGTNNYYITTLGIVISAPILRGTYYNYPKGTCKYPYRKGY